MWRKAILGGVALAALLGAWTFYLEPASLRLRAVPLELPGWPAELDGLEVALLSDLHVGSPYYGLDQLEHVVLLVNEAEPDVVLLAGDYVIDDVTGGEWVAPEDIAQVLGQLDAKLGVYAVLGNHDFWLDAERVRAAFENSGIEVLDDEAVRLSELWVVGFADLWEGSPDVDQALTGINDQAPVIAVTHNPDLFPEVPARVALTMAGHTHGGQVNLPFFGTPIVPSRFGDRYVHGHIVEEGRHLFVTAGLGTSIIPARFRVPPEVALLRLSGADRSVAPATGGR